MGAHLQWTSIMTQVTKSFLASLKKVYKPKIAISENVCTGNIGRRVVENVKDVMQSKATMC